ncbi:Mrp/NBP35 family ATP-binding protein [Caldisericum sp. AR60]|uniref:Mrp/NBP35 family ATP-binding protein n=1 Tax=Caldisericum sp. AR60 TaxID=3397852 RepID=UPI0039FBB726
MPILQTQVIDVLKTTYVPKLKKLLLNIGSIDGVEVVGKKVNIALRLNPLDEETLQQLKDIISKRLTQLGAEVVEFEITFKEQPKIKYIIAIGSGKGGVGKSTVTTNLAVALANLGYKVGIMDADIYGPNIPKMFGVEQELPKVTQDRKMIPVEKFGVKLISIGFLLEDPSTPVIWRGPLATKALEQLYEDVEWGELDFLLIDLPPGTGDVALTIAQTIPTHYGIIVTTPQSVSVLDASKALVMFKQMNMEVLGVIENMSYFRCPHCGTKTEIFGAGGGRKLAESQGVPFLGSVPLEVQVREGGDEGIPSFFVEGNSEVREAFTKISNEILNILK